MSLLKVFTNTTEQNQYYGNLEKIALKLSSYPELIEKNLSKYVGNKLIKIVTEEEITLFIKPKEQTQKKEILYKIKKKVNEGNQLFIYPLLIYGNQNSVIYDWYDLNFHEIINDFYHKNNFRFLINCIQRILIAIENLYEMKICHFDLHLKNILYNETVRSEWVFNTSNGKYKFTDCPYEIVIGDFGLSLSFEDDKYKDEILFFYKNFFPLIYFTVSEKKILSQYGYQFLDLWRFLKTLLNNLSNFPFAELRNTIHFIGKYTNMCEKYICGQGTENKNPGKVALELVEILQWEIERLNDPFLGQ
jgi:serine/threonine protein kinase